MRKTLIHSTLLSILFLSIPTSVTAQEGKDALHDWLFQDNHLKEMVAPLHPTVQMEAFPRLDIDSTIDVLSYELWTDWSMALTTPRDERPERKAESRILIKMKIIDGIQPLIQTIELDARSLIIDSVLVDGSRAGFLKETATLRVDLNSGITGGDSIDIDIYYANASDTRGFYCFSQAEADTLVEVLRPIAFTFSEPQDARRWFPCNDKPHDKAYYTVHCRVPLGYTVVSNGIPIDSVADSDTTSWQTWQHDEPMPTYLLTVNASRYHRYDQSYVNVEGDTIPILNYHWVEDQDGDDFSAVRALVNIPAMFVALEKYFGVYRFNSYGHVSVAPVNIGGMEHQSMSTINRRWLRGNAEAGYAHEIGHQWIGDQVSCATWDDIWLNEGGASWSEALWRLEKEGPEGYQAHLNYKRDRYLRNGLSEPPVYGIPLFMLFNEATTYNKSAWVFHMMRRLVGDEAMFPAVRSFFAKYDMKSAQTADLLEHMKEEIPSPLIDWDLYFDQWLFKAGHPVYIAINQASDVLSQSGYRNTVTLRQVQSAEGVPTAFEMPVTVRFLGTENIYDTTVVMRERVMSFSAFTQFEVDSIDVDPNDDILCQSNSNTITSVNEEFETRVSVSPVPVQHGEMLNVSVPAGSTITVYNVTGTLLTSFVEQTDFARISTAGWPIGLAVITVQSNGNLQTITVPVID